jgi:hypothetical protein
VAYADIKRLEKHAAIGGSGHKCESSTTWASAVVSGGRLICLEKNHCARRRVAENDLFESKKDVDLSKIDCIVSFIDRENYMLTYAMWNNKGGTGKTSLTFQAVCRYAELNPDKKILVVDICPQANLSELMLGGQANNGSVNLLQRHGMTPRCSIGGYFDARLPAPFSPPKFDAYSYITHVQPYNPAIPVNIDLVCGDPLLELQAIAMNTLANVDLPGVNTWLGVIDWLRDFMSQVRNEYDFAFNC